MRLGNFRMMLPVLLGLMAVSALGAPKRDLLPFAPAYDIQGWRVWCSNIDEPHSNCFAQRRASSVLFNLQFSSSQIVMSTRLECTVQEKRNYQDEITKYKITKNPATLKTKITEDMKILSSKCMSDDRVISDFSIIFPLLLRISPKQ